MTSVSNRSHPFCCIRLIRKIIQAIRQYDYDKMRMELCIGRNATYYNSLITLAAHNRDFSHELAAFS